MTNPHKGDVPFEAGGKTYTLRYSHLALVKLEKMVDVPLGRLMRDFDKMESMRLGTVVALLWAGLQKHHSTMTYDDAAELLDVIDGGVAGAMVPIGDAFQKAFNAPGTKGTNPPQQAGNGTGTSYSSSTPVTVTTPMPSGSLLPES